MQKKSFSRFVARDIVIVALLLACAPGFLKAADKNRSVVNKYGAPVIDAKGHHVTYDRETLEAMAHKASFPKGTNATAGTLRTTQVVEPRQFAPAGGQTQQPFWQYAIFGSGIGASNIVVGPTPQICPPEIIIGGNSTNN